MELVDCRTACPTSALCKVLQAEVIDAVLESSSFVVPRHHQSAMLPCPSANKSESVAHL
jgi:hypothetical protein